MEGVGDVGGVEGVGVAGVHMDSFGDVGDGGKE